MPYVDVDKRREYGRNWANKKNRIIRSLENRTDGTISLKRGVITWAELNKEDYSKISTWKECVEKSKGYILGRRINRMAIAAIAIRACDIKLGGRRKKEEEVKKTIVAFANEAGIHRKTLSDWIRIRRNIINHLPENIKVIEYSAAKYASDALYKHPDSNPEELYRKFAGQEPQQRTVTWCIRGLETLANHLSLSNLS